MPILPCKSKGVLFSWYVCMGASGCMLIVRCIERLFMGASREVLDVDVDSEGV